MIQQTYRLVLMMLGSLALVTEMGCARHLGYQDGDSPLDPIAILNVDGTPRTEPVLLVFRTFQSTRWYGGRGPAIGYVREYKSEDPMPVVPYGTRSWHVTMDDYFILSPSHVPVACGMQGTYDGWDNGGWVFLDNNNRTHRLRALPADHVPILWNRLLNPIINGESYLYPGESFKDDPLSQWLAWSSSKVAICLTDEERELVKKYFVKESSTVSPAP